MQLLGQGMGVVMMFRCNTSQQMCRQKLQLRKQQQQAHQQAPWRQQRLQWRTLHISCTHMHPVRLGGYAHESLRGMLLHTLRCVCIQMKQREEEEEIWVLW